MKFTAARSLTTGALLSAALAVSAPGCAQGAAAPASQKAANAADYAEPSVDAASDDATAGKTPVLGSTTDGATFTGAGDVAVFRTIEVPDQPFTTSHVAAVSEATDPVWDVALTTPYIEEPIRKGDVLHGSFWVRADFEADDQNESGTGEFAAYLQKPEDGWTGLATLAGTPSSKWRQRYFTTVAEQDFDPGSVNFVFQLGGKKQIFSVGGMRLYNLGPDVDPASLPTSKLDYPGRDPEAPWRAEAQKRIDDFRKSELTVEVVDGDGNPVPGATVQAELSNRAFGVGTFLGSDPEVMKDTPSGEKARAVMDELFNVVTCAVYGADWGWQDPEQRELYLKALDWAESEGYPIRAHVLVWPGWRWSPAAWKALADAGQAEELRQTVEDHVREVAGELAGRDIDVVDVFNEPRANQDIDEAVGEPSPRPSWFNITREVAPNIRLAINEFGIVSGFGTNQANIDGYKQAIRELLDAGAPLDVIGVQGHIGESFTAPEQLWKVLDDLSEFGLPIHVTEFDVATDDEAVQADYTRDFMQAAFAHPAVEQVTLWGHWEGDQWLPQAALFREDWTPYPAGEALRELITETWHTSAEVETGSDGEAVVDGIHGTYDVTVTHDGASRSTTAELIEGGTRVQVVVD